MAVEHSQDRAHKGHLCESLRNAIGDEISRLKSLWIEVEFERAFLTRLTCAFHDALRMLVSTAAQAIRIARKSFTLVSVGPVMTESPRV